MSAKSNRVCDLSCGAMHEFALVLDKAGFTARIVQNIIQSKNNEHAKLMLAAIGSKLIEDKFKLRDWLDIAVPADYDPEDHREDWRRFDPDHASRNRKDFPEKAPMLQPGQKFRVKIFDIRDVVDSEDCLARLRLEKAVLVGAQGLFLIYKHFPRFLSSSWAAISFAEKDALQKIDGDYFVPVVDDRYDPSVRYLNSYWDEAYCLLCFCPE